MAGFKQTYLITYRGITDNFVYEDLEVEITTPYDWDKQQDVALLFTLIKRTLEKDFDKFHIERIDKL